MKIVLLGTPITKKNSQQIIQVKGRLAIIPSKQFKCYEADCKRQIGAFLCQRIDQPVNVKCVYYMPTRRRVDLTNLLEATDDILVSVGVLKDDNSQIIVSHDGSRVRHDKLNPRVEIDITESFEEVLM